MVFSALLPLGRFFSDANFSFDCRCVFFSQLAFSILKDIYFFTFSTFFRLSVSFVLYSKLCEAHLRLCANMESKLF